MTDEEVAKKHNISFEKYVKYLKLENVLMSDAFDALADLYEANLKTDENFIFQTTIYKLLHLIQDIAYFKFVLNRKHAYEENKFIYCQDCQDYNLNK